VTPDEPVQGRCGGASAAASQQTGNKRCHELIFTFWGIEQCAGLRGDAPNESPLNPEPGGHRFAIELCGSP